jgi:hypothetical protein
MPTDVLASATAIAAITAVLLATACDKPGPVGSPPPAIPPTATPEPGEIPLLPVQPGDVWRYQVKLEIPAGAASPDAPASVTSHQLTRTYLGKVKPLDHKPAVDCFEVVIPGSATERELVEIYPDRILMRGSIVITAGVAAKPLWLEPPVPFVLSNIKVGAAFPELSVAEGSRTRHTSVVAREEVTVPAGTFRAIRLLMTGTDGPLDLLRTIWFAPGVGIVRQEKTRHLAAKMLLRETQELLETSVKRP